MGRIFIAFGFFSVLSCKDSRLTLKDAITSNCFWDRTEDNEVIGGLNSCYKFLPDGRCYEYYFNFYNKKITDSVYRFADTDIMVPTTWSVVGDTLLIARGTDYKVLNFSKDSITLIGYESDTMIFRKNCKTKLESPIPKTSQ